MKTKRSDIVADLGDKFLRPSCSLLEYLLVIAFLVAMRHLDSIWTVAPAAVAFVGLDVWASRVRWRSYDVTPRGEDEIDGDDDLD